MVRAAGLKLTLRLLPDTNSSEDESTRDDKSLGAAAWVTYYIGKVIRAREFQRQLEHEQTTAREEQERRARQEEERQREQTRREDEAKRESERRADERRREAIRRTDETFRALYDQFWGNPVVVKIRRCVVNDQEYNLIAPALKRRNDEYPNSNNLPKEDNDVLEDVDRFCATLVRIKSYVDLEPMTARQRDVWSKLLLEFWLDRIKSNRRDELLTYISNHWPKELLSEPLERATTIPQNNEPV